MIEGIILLFSGKSLIFSWAFILIGLFLFIDDILAETIDKSVFENIHSDPIKLKIAGIIFFVCMEIIFIMLLIN